MKNFTQYLQSKNLSPKTIEAYNKLINKYLEWKKDKSTSKKIVLKYLENFENNSPKTKAQILGVLRLHYDYLIENKQLTNNPTNLLKIRGAKRKIIYKTLSPEEINELIDCHFLSIKSDENHQLRNHLILTFSAYQGMKWQEIKDLKTKDINLQKGTIFIEKQLKTNSRTLKLEASQIGVLYQFIQVPFGDLGADLLFTTFADAGRLTKSIKKTYPKFHNFLQLRASFITHNIQTQGLRKTQYLAGHRYISSTENYLSTDIQSLQDDIQKFGSDF